MKINHYQLARPASRSLLGSEIEHWAFGHNAQIGSLREPADLAMQASRH